MSLDLNALPSGPATPWPTPGQPCACAGCQLPTYCKAPTQILHKPMPQPLNPDTHCTACGEPLSVFGHCWQHDYPPMDPKQDAEPSLQTVQPEKSAIGAKSSE